MNPDQTQPTSTPVVTPISSQPSQNNSSTMASGFQNAIKQAQVDPTSAYARTLMSRIQSGQMNDYLTAAGYDPSKFVTAPPQTQTQPAPQNNPIVSMGKNIINDTNSNAANIVQDLTPSNNKNIKDVVTNALDIGGGVANEVGSFFGNGLNLLAQATTPKPVYDAITSELSKAVQSVAGTPQAKALADQWNQFEAKNPQVAKSVGNVVNIAALAGGGEVSPTVEEASNMVKQGAEAVSQAGKDIVTNAKEAMPNAKEALQTKYISDAKADWSKPTTVSNATYSKPTEIFKNAASKGSNIDETLVKNGIKLSDNVQDGKYATADTADKLRADAGKMSNEMLRPALQVADKTVPKTSVQDVIDKTVADIKGSKLTAGDMESQIAKAKSEGEALARKYRDGMSLENMHDERISYNSNRYSPIGLKSDSNAASVDRAFGRSLGTTVIEKAPKDIPVQDFQKELQKQYHAADYLDSLDTKKVPTSLGARLRQTAGKVVGASAGASLGGGILGGVGGYHIGGLVESALENMKNPVKEYFLKNMQTTNPEAFNKISDYLKQVPKGEGAIPETKNLMNITLGKIESYEGVASTEEKSGFGLAKIKSDHPEVIPYLQDAVQKGKIVEKLPQRTILQTNPIFDYKGQKKSIRVIIDHQLGTKDGIIKKTFVNNAYFVP